MYDPIKYLLGACEPYYEPGSYILFGDPLVSSCIGAFDAMAEHVLRERAACRAGVSAPRVPAT